MTIYRTTFALLLTCLMCRGEASAKVLPAFVKDHNLVRSAVFSNWASSLIGKTSASTYSVVLANCVIDATHDSLQQAYIESSSGNAQFDAECLEAVLGAVLPPKPRYINRLIILFNTTRKPHFKIKDEGKDETVRIFRIPLTVLRLYPGLFSTGELLNQRNLVPLASQKSTESLSKLSVQQINQHYENWNEFFKNHPKLQEPKWYLLHMNQRRNARFSSDIRASNICQIPRYDSVTANLYFMDIERTLTRRGAIQ